MRTLQPTKCVPQLSRFWHPPQPLTGCINCVRDSGKYRLAGRLARAVVRQVCGSDHEHYLTRFRAQCDSVGRRALAGFLASFDLVLSETLSTARVECLIHMYVDLIHQLVV